MPIPDDETAIATYPIAMLTASGDKATSQAFIDYITSSDGQATLKSFGFLRRRESARRRVPWLAVLAMPSSASPSSQFPSSG